jgi:CO/xanthine dehydrogenase Mo-binding subunit
VSIRTISKTRGSVGESVRRVDGIPKVKGQFAFGSDLWADEMLWGHTLRTPHPHARIRSVDVSKALATPGVHAVLLAGDVPGRNTYGLEFADQPVLASDRVRYAGEPVAILAAADPETARRAAEKIVVEYEALPAVTDMEQALEPEAPRIHEFGNVLRHIHIVHGDPSAPADVWVEGYYETGMQDQAMLGPESGMAVPADDGGVAARGPAADRAVSWPAPRQGPAAPGRSGRCLRGARRRQHAHPRLPAGVADRPAGEDGL